MADIEMKMETKPNTDTVTKEERFFGFPPSQFIDQVYNVVDDYFCDAADYLEKHMQRCLTSSSSEVVDDETTRLLTAQTNRLLEIMRKVCDRNFDKFEIYLARNIFNIPEEIDLDEICTSSTQNESTTTKEKIHNIEEEIIAQQKRNEELARRNAQLKWSNQSCENALAELSKQLNQVTQINELVDHQTVERVIRMTPEVRKCSEHYVKYTIFTNS
mmetsp:Transcript_11839/g.15420  ORF Transcript_11839/g.15420 Transcript_11839/m.15420 type:complete len:216 (+) Transcript_11839:170-817(+)